MDVDAGQVMSFNYSLIIGSETENPIFVEEVTILVQEVYAITVHQQRSACYEGLNFACRF